MQVWLPALTGRRVAPPLNEEGDTWEDCTYLREVGRGVVKIYVRGHTYEVRIRYLRTSKCRQCLRWCSMEHERAHRGYCSTTCKEAMDVRRGFSS